MLNRDNRIHEDKYNDCSFICFHAFGDPGLQKKINSVIKKKS